MFEVPPASARPAGPSSYLSKWKTPAVLGNSLFKKQKQTYLENVQIIDSSVLICSFQEAKKKINTFSWRCMCSAACQAVVLLVRLQGWVVLAGASVSGD